ncbi:riboflavin synthase [soil metagenome]
MFTGLIEEVGTIRAIEPIGDGIRISIAAHTIMADLAVDHSISVNGVCLTATTVHEEYFSVTAVHETIAKTTTGALRVGSSVNLERAVRVSDRLGGHIVQGHVDCTGTVDAITHLDAGWELWVRFPLNYAKYLIPVGSVCVNGISLTVARIDDDRFMVALIPHTIEHTSMKHTTVGDAVNLEFDVLAKYIERLLHP